MSVAEIAFRIGRRIGKHPLAGRIFCITERLLPLRRIARRDELVAFNHPRPIADPHVLIVPTRPIASLTTDQIDDSTMGAIIWEMLELGRELTSGLPASENWQLVINGGTRQDIGQMHAHLLHAETPCSTGIPLQDSAIKPGGWQQVFMELRDAEQIPDNGYSLEIRWATGADPVAKVTQSART